MAIHFSSYVMINKTSYKRPKLFLYQVINMYILLLIWALGHEDLWRLTFF